MWNKRNRNKRPTALDSEVTEENPKEQKKEIIDQMWIHVQVFTSADRTDIHTPWCLRFTIQANNLNHRTTAPYSSGRPGIGNWPAKVSTSALISAALCWNFSSWDRAWTNSFRGALGSRLLCTSKVNSMPAKEGEQPTQQDCVALFVLVKKKALVLPLWMKSATFLKSCCTKPLEVRAGEPNLRPLGRKALLSPKKKKQKKHYVRTEQQSLN